MAKFENGGFLLTAALITNLPRQDRLWIGLSLAGLCGLSWLYLVRMAHEMGPGGSCCMALFSPWSLSYFWMNFWMWTVMMVAMMVPSVLPMVLAFAALNRNRSVLGRMPVPTWIFFLGYIVSWTLFSALATFLQQGLHAASLLSPISLKVGPVLGGLLFVTAGLYQWTPLKNACLSKCAAPLDFLLTEWREGKKGALIMGLRHGWFCIGCCAFLMVLLFIIGVMNLVWVAVVAALVLSEKLFPQNYFASRAFGLIFLAMGVGLIAKSI